MNHIKKHFALLSPVYWPAWLLLGLLWLISRLPPRWQMGIGRFFGRAVYRLSSKLRHITETNIKLCFPELTQAEQTALIKKNFESLGLGIIETGMAWWTSDKKLKAQCKFEINGYDSFKKISTPGKSIIFLSPHFTCLEMIGRMAGPLHPITAMYRPHKNRLLALMQTHFRQKYSLKQIAKHRMREVLNTMKDNQGLWYAYDIDAGKKRGVFAPFFGIQTASLTSLSRVASMTNALVIPIDFCRLDDGWGYRLNFYPPLENFPGENFVADATRLNAHIEKSVRNNPEQYIWQYKRFKTRPEGEKRFY